MSGGEQPWVSLRLWEPVVAFESLTQDAKEATVAEVIDFIVASRSPSAKSVSYGIGLAEYA